MRSAFRDKFPRLVALLFSGFIVCASVLASAVFAVPPAPSTTPVIVDTDAGVDDLLALAFLLARNDVRIEAITVVNGVARVPVGAKNVLALLQLAGRPEIPVYEGSTTPLTGHVEFPDVWRTPSEQLSGVDLPKAHRHPQTESAVPFLVRRLADSKHPVRILALGPLTNIAAALRQNPSCAKTIEEIVIMGGAVRVPGNLGDGGAYKTDNKTAEWNIYADPLAASIVFGSKAPIRLIPLDATRQVPIHSDFVASFQNAADGTLKRFVAQILASDDALIRRGYFYAWDPLAAVALVDPDVVTVTPLAIRIEMSGNERGRTVEVPGGIPNARVALTADASVFRREFLGTLSAAKSPPEDKP